MAIFKLLPALLLSISVCAAQTAAERQLPDGPGKTVTARMCGSCHDIKVVTAKKMSRERWERNVDQMISRGATGSDEEIEQVIEYLAAHFGPVVVNVNTADAVMLAGGLGLTAEEADAIVKHRERNGAYRTRQDVGKTPGVDSAKIERAKDQIRTEEPDKKP